MRKELIAQRDPKSPVSETFRTLRTNIQFMNTNNKLKTLLITSTSPGEGKSWVASNLAVTFAHAGKKVILIDADMRKGRQYTIFEVSPRPGLSNYLSGIDSNSEENSMDEIIDYIQETEVKNLYVISATIFEVSPRPGLSNYLSGIDSNSEENSMDEIIDYIQETEVKNLYVISAGNIPPNPSELLITPKMVNLLDKLKQVSDIVIIDGTPCELVTDSVILSRLVDSTVIVTAHKQTKKDALQKIVTNIQNVGGKIAGIVLNKISVILSRLVDSTVIVTAHKQTKKDALQKIVTNIQNVGGKIAGIVLNKIPVSAKRYEQSYYYGSTSMKKENNNRGPRYTSSISPRKKSKMEELKNRVKPKNPQAIRNERELDNKNEDTLQSKINIDSKTNISEDKARDIFNQINDFMDNDNKEN